jgi:hypothetical protein
MNLPTFYKNIATSDKKRKFKKQVMRELSLKENTFYFKLKNPDFSPAEWAAIEKIAGVVFEKEWFNNPI